MPASCHRRMTGTMVDLDALDHAGLFARYPDAAPVPPVAADFYHVMHVPGARRQSAARGTCVQISTSIWDARAMPASSCSTSGPRMGSLRSRWKSAGRVWSRSTCRPIACPTSFRLRVAPAMRRRRRTGSPTRRQAFWAGHRAFGSSVRLHESHAGGLDPPTHRLRRGDHR